MKARTIERKRWVVIFYELGYIAENMKHDYIHDMGVDDDSLVEILNNCRERFMKNEFSKDWITFYRHYFCRTFTIPKVAEILGTKGKTYRVEMQIEWDKMIRPDEPEIIVRNVDNYDEHMTVKNISEIETMRKNQELKFNDFY